MLTVKRVLVAGNNPDSYDVEVLVHNPAIGHHWLIFKAKRDGDMWELLDAHKQPFLTEKFATLDHIRDSIKEQVEKAGI